MQKMKIDLQDIHLLRKKKIHLAGAKRGQYPAVAFGGKQYHVHRLIMGQPKGLQVDHINGDRFDNRRRNLRICTNRQNNYNKTAYSNNKSGYKGVSWSKKGGHWCAQWSDINGKRINVRGFKTPEDAAKYYDKMVALVHPEYAKLNGA